MLGPFESLTLHNFLCYEKAHFDFHPGVNMIIGPTDHGKSAIMDAFYKLMWNSPTGTDFQSWWGGETVIALKTQEHIIRYRKEKTATYQIKNRKTKKVTTFKAFGAKVPQEITDLLQMDRKINVQKQLEKKAPIFLLSESPGDVAKHLNGVANLGGIDIAIDAGKADLKATNTQKKIVDAQIITKTAELQKYDGLNEFKILVIHAEKIEKRINRLSDMCVSLNNYVLEINNTQEKIKVVKKKLAIAPIVKEANTILLTSLELKNELSSIRGRFIEIQQVRKKVIDIENQLKIKPYVKRGVALVQIKAEYQTTIDFYTESLAKIEKGKQSIAFTKKELKSHKQAYNKLMPKTCPFCGSKVEK